MKDMSALDKALEAILDEAAKEANMELGKNLQEPEEEIQFSAESEARMRKLFQQERKKRRVKTVRRYSKRAVCALLAVLIISGVAVFSVSAWRVKFLNFILNVGEPNTDYSFGEESQQSYSDDEITLAYIPDGFALEEQDQTERKLKLRFGDGEQYFDLIVNKIAGRMSVDTEDSTGTQQIEINGREAVFTANDNVGTLIWADDTHAYRLMGNLSQAEIIKIAENVKI